MGDFIAVDAKMTIDDNALFRHPDIGALRDDTTHDVDGDPRRLAADRHHINYIAHGWRHRPRRRTARGWPLRRSTCWRHAGGRPANFMDVRTTATSLDVAFGFDLLLSNPAVRAVLVNVHGGGMQRCDTIAEGIGISPCAVPGAGCPWLCGSPATMPISPAIVCKTFGIRFIEGATSLNAGQACRGLSEAGGSVMAILVGAQYAASSARA